MIPIVFSLEEAKEWFLANSHGSVKCVDEAHNRDLVCSTFPQAKAFYEAAHA
jgi:hypothetical protein